MSKFKFKAGLEAEDIVTGFKGTITYRVKFLTGCNQYGIQPKFNKEKAETPNAQQFDENRIKILSDTKVVLNDEVKDSERMDNVKTPGGLQPFVGK